MSMREGGGKPLPKFGEWDVNNPASADGFTVIFSKARDEKKGGATTTADSNRQQTLDDNDKSKKNSSSTAKKKWFCFI